MNFTQVANINTYKISKSSSQSSKLKPGPLTKKPMEDTHKSI